MKKFCFEVWKNGKKISVAGLPETGVLSFILTWVGNLPDASALSAASNEPLQDVTLRVGGLDTSGPNRHVEWLKEGEEEPALRIGDEFRVLLTASETPDVPIDAHFAEDRSRHEKCSFCGKGREMMHKTFLRGGLVGPRILMCTRCLVLAEKMLDDEKIDHMFHLSRTTGKTCSFCKTKRDAENASGGDESICKTCVDRVLKDTSAD